MDGRMDGCMDGSVGGCLDGEGMDGSMRSHKHRGGRRATKEGRAHRGKDGCLDRWFDGSMLRWMDLWADVGIKEKKALGDRGDSPPSLP